MVESLILGLLPTACVSILGSLNQVRIPALSCHTMLPPFRGPFPLTTDIDFVPHQPSLPSPTQMLLYSIERGCLVRTNRKPVVSVRAAAHGDDRLRLGAGTRSVHYQLDHPQNQGPFSIPGFSRFQHWCSLLQNV